MADQITWTDIEKLWEYGEKEKKRSKKKEKRMLEKAKRKRERGERVPKSKAYQAWEKWAGEKREEELRKYSEPSIKDLGELARDKVRKYFGSLESEIARLRESGRDITKREKIRFLEDLVKSLRQGAKKLEHELEFKRLAHAYKPGFLDKILNYVRGKRKPKLYLLALFLLYFAFRGKSSVVGYTVMESVTNSYFVSYLLVFILFVCLVFYQLDKK